MKLKPTTRSPARALLATCLLAAAVPAGAETSPYYFGGSLGINHLSNIYRQAFTSNSDTVSSIGLLGGIDQHLGRQRLVVDATAQANHYQDNGDLDNLAYTLKAALEWASLGRLSGTLSIGSSEALADYNVGRGVEQIFKKNIERNDQALALLRLGLVTRYSMEASLSYRERNFTAEEYDGMEYRQYTGGLGLVYKPSEDLRLGVAARHTDGVYPRYAVVIANTQVATVEDDYTRDDFDLTAQWNASGASKLNARISLSRAEHSVSNTRDFSGVTGVVSWAWQPGARWSLNTQLSRETGQETLAAGADQSRITTALQLDSSYQLTGKISLTAGIGLSRADRNSGPLVTRDFDKDRSYKLGAIWAISRTLNLGCQLSHTQRDSSTPQFAFDANSYGCTMRALFD